MPRPIEYDKDDVLQKAMELFWSQGYESTSVRDVLDTTGFNRHSLYEEFGGKDGLFKAVLEHYKQHIAGQVIGPLQASDSDLNTIKKIFEQRAELDNKRKTNGCLFTNTANCKPSLDKELFDLAKLYNRKVEQALEKCISHGQAKGQIPQHKDAKTLARYVATVLHGLGPMCKLGANKKEILAIGEMTTYALTQP